MQLIDFTATDINDLNAYTTVALRQLAKELGFKGMSSRRGEAIREVIRTEWKRLQDEKAPAPAPKSRKSVKCIDCGFRRMSKHVIGPDLCDVCLGYAEWENVHQDNGWDSSDESHDECPICHPELDKRYVRNGKSRAGMVIVAKGSEIHKSLVLKEAAEAIGWTVEIERETYELPEGAEGEGTRYYATATRGDNSISLAWDGRAYDYPASSARINGKDRKVRNLKEALRLLVA